MATPIVMPSLGMYTAEGTLVNWLQPDGAPVKQGEAVLEIETEKAVNAVISPADGILFHAARVGTLVREQGLLGYILAQGEPAPAASEIDLQGSERKFSERAVTTEEGRVPPRGDRLKVSPIARRLAHEFHVDLWNVVGSGPGGRILEADIKAVFARTATKARADEDSGTGGRVTELDAMRRTIGRRLRRSVDNSVSLTITREVQADDIVRARTCLAQTLNMSVPYDALFMKFLAVALRENPGLNVVLECDRLRAFDSVDICFAVALPGGLAVPVVRDVDKLPLAEMIRQINRLTEQARSNSLRSEDLSGGISTVTNLGAQGVDIFTPILNPPQATILGVGRIAERPFAKNAALTVAYTCWLSLTFDHRVADGAAAANVLRSIAKRMTDADYLCSLA